MYLDKRYVFMFYRVPVNVDRYKDAKCIFKMYLDKRYTRYYILPCTCQCRTDAGELPPSDVQPKQKIIMTKNEFGVFTNIFVLLIIQHSL